MKLHLAWLFVASFGLVSCMDQYNPLPYWKQFKTERNITSQKHLALTDKGELPVREAASGPTDPISAKFSSLCASCHGAQGAADGAAAAAMNPKPRNFHEKDWQAKVSDEHIATVIKNGGAAVGLSPTMPPWGGVLSDEEVKGLVEKIRGFGK